MILRFCDEGRAGVGAKSAWEPPFSVKFSGQGRHPGAPDGVGEQTEQAEETARPVNRSRCGAGMGVLAVRWAGWGWSLVPGLGSGGARGVRALRPWRRHRRSRGAAASWGRRWRALNQVAAGTRGASPPGHGPPPGDGRGTRTTGDIVAVRQAGQQDRAPCDRSRARSPLGRSSLEGAATRRATPLPGQGPGPARDRSDRPHSVALTPPHPARRPRDQRHDLAGTTGHRPVNQLTRQRIDRRDPDRHGHEHPVPDSCTRQAPGPPTHLGTPTPSQPPTTHEVAHARPRPTSHQTPPPYDLNKSRRRGRRPRVSGPHSPGRAPRPGERCDRLAVPGSARHRVHSSSAPRAASSSESPRTGR
ncbi:hypothetical protein AIF0345_3072 [Actinomyces israelii]|nr:hypothetical protein AIF0345_3072 [Actinomyces israelii]